MNDNKIEVLIISNKTSRHRAELAEIRLNIGSHVIKPTLHSRDLGAWIDDKMNMKMQVSQTVKAGYHHLRTISRKDLRRNLGTEPCARAINATVTSRQDYQNALLAGSHLCAIKPLQRLQNCAARLLTGTPRAAHITPVLRNLHWLPVKERADFKLLMHIHSAVLCPNAPQYTREIFKEK